MRLEIIVLTICGMLEAINRLIRQLQLCIRSIDVKSKCTADDLLLVCVICLAGDLYLVRLQSRNTKNLLLFTWFIPLLLQLPVVDRISVHGFCVRRRCRRQWLHGLLLMLLVVVVVHMHAKYGRYRIALRGVLLLFW